MSHSKYLDITTDYGFKKVFGTDTSKDLLISLLNELFRGRKVIVDLFYDKNEHVGDGEDIGSVIFDLTCTADNGEKIIIEVQRSTQVNLKRRMLYYSSRLIADQAPKGNRKGWSYNISEVYVIVLMDGFHMPDGDGLDQVLHDVCLCDRDSGKIFYGDLGYIYVELINFVKTETELVSDLDRWLYVFNNMSRMDKLPVYLRRPIFEKLFRLAEYSKLSKEEREMYDLSLKRKWDAQSLKETQEILLRRALQEGIAAGIERGKEEGEREKSISIALQFKKMGLSISDIAKGTGLSVEEIEKLK